MNEEDLDYFKSILNNHLVHLNRVNIDKYKRLVASMENTDVEDIINSIFVFIVARDKGISVRPARRNSTLGMYRRGHGPCMDSWFTIHGFRLECHAEAVDQLTSTYNIEFCTPEKERIYTLNINVLEFGLLTSNEKETFLKSCSREFYKGFRIHLEKLIEKNEESTAPLEEKYQESSRVLERFLEIIGE